MLINHCPGCGGAGCKQCITRQAPKIFIPIEPMGAVRTTRAMAGRTEAGQRYAQYKHDVALMASHRLREKIEGKAIVVDVTFYMPIPSTGKTTRLNYTTGKRIKVDVVDGMPHMTKPDNDNLIKGLFDALNGIAWADDSQVFEIKSKKIYSEYPGIEFGIEYID